jgi:hypothetical protein
MISTAMSYRDTDGVLKYSTCGGSAWAVVATRPPQPLDTGAPGDHYTRAIVSRRRLLARPLDLAAPGSRFLTARFDKLFETL